MKEFRYYSWSVNALARHVLRILKVAAEPRVRAPRSEFSWRVTGKQQQVLEQGHSQGHRLVCLLGGPL